MDYKCGDIVTINFNPRKGDEVGKIRPAIIISGDDENSILDTIIVMPLTTQLLDDMQPYRLRIQKRDGLKYESDILINQIRTISKKRVGRKIARLHKQEYDDLVNMLCANFQSAG